MSLYLDILPLIILAIGGIIIFLAGAFLPPRPPWLLFVLSLLTTVAAGIASIFLVPSSPNYLNLLDLSDYSRFFTILLLLITVLTLLLVYRYSRLRNFSRDEFYGLLVNAALGMVLVAAASHWLVFFLGLQVLSIALYVIIPIRLHDPLGQEAGVKYFIMSAVASAFLTFGIALLYGVTGSLDLHASLALNVQGTDLIVPLLGLALILVGIGFKISMVPLHLWTPDVYEGAPAPVTAFLSSGSKVALFAGLIRIALHLGEAAWAVAWPALWVLAVLTMAVGNITALYQTKVKRLLAYSSIAQMGYLLMALVAIKQGTLPALLFFLAVYAVMDLGAFGLLGALSEVREDLDDLPDFQGLGVIYPWNAAVFAACLLSLVGLPPTGGFLGKLFLFWAVIKGGFIWLAVAGIITAILSIYFYLKVLATLYMLPQTRQLNLPSTDLAMYLAGVLIFALLLWSGLAPGPLLANLSYIADLFYHP
jgi:NADH-quinone oxidoreductase subunit N